MSLVAWYPLTGNLNNYGVGDCTVTGTPTYLATGKIGSCLNSSASIQISMPTPGKAWTICFWGYVESALVTANWTGILHLTDGLSNVRFEVCPKTCGNGIYCYSIHNNSSNAIFSSSIASPTNCYDRWTHICLTSDGTTITKYIDGVVVGTTAYNGSGNLTGQIRLLRNHIIRKNDIRFYDEALSQTEIARIAEGLVLHYTFDDPAIANETSLIDESGYMITSTISNKLTSVTTEDCRPSAYFSSSYLINKNFNFSFNTFTLSCKWKKQTSGNSCIACCRTLTGYGFSFFHIGTTIRIDMPVAATNQHTIKNFTLALDTWYHTVLTFDGTACKFYIDGKLQDTWAISYSNAYLSSVFAIGASHSNGTSVGNYLNGNISDFRLYSTAFSEQQAKALYAVPAKIDRTGNIYANVINEGVEAIKINRIGALECNRLVETYKTSDGAEWLPICVHNNQGGTNLFPATGDYTKPVYKNEECWCNFGAINGVDHGTNYEFLVMQQAGIDSKFDTFRFSQTVDPMTATWNDVKPGSTNVTLGAGMSSSYGGTYFRNGSSAKMCFANGSSSNWFGCGISSSWGGGIPSICSTACIGYQLVYIRIYSSNTKILKTNIIETKELKEI